MNLDLDHVELYVGDAAATAARLQTSFGFRLVATAPDTAGGEYRSLALRQDGITLVVTEGLADTHPATAYVASHGDGVAGIAFRTADAKAALAAALAGGARPVTDPVRWKEKGWVTGSIATFGDVVHSFIQRPDNADTAVPLPGFEPVADAPAESGTLCQIDHFAVCLDDGTLTPTVEYYERVLGFRVIYSEHIAVGSQAMDSAVVQSPSGTITLTLIEPDAKGQPGQIDDFLKEHGGPGVQHIAFSTKDIVRSVADLSAAGTVFLSTPDAYYDLLEQRMTPATHGFDELRRLNILLDEDHDGQLFQIFTRSIHPRGTLFFELIERAGARTFGSGNIKALYEAVQLATSQSHPG